EDAGRSADAADLYYQLANRTQSHELQVRCYNRIHFLREGMKTSVPPNYRPAQPTQANYPNQYNDPRFIPTPNYVAGQPQYTPASRAMSAYNQQPGGIAPGYAPPAPNAQSSGPGWLRRAPFWLDQKVTYVLESSQGMPRMYISPQPGLNLEPYVGRNVDVS